MLKALALCLGVVLGTAHAHAQTSPPLSSQPATVYSTPDPRPAAPQLSYILDIQTALQKLPPNAFVPGRRSTIKKGDQGPDVLVLRQGLMHWGWPSMQYTDYFDEDLSLLLQSFQNSKGIDDDGVAGPSTWRALSFDPTAMQKEAVAYTTALNAIANKNYQNGHERIVVVNIPAYTLWVFNLKTGQTELESRVVVGKPHTKTPRREMKIVDLKYNPGWSPPPSIGGRFVPPGENNPLGQLRFSTQGGGNVYLHDTNQRYLFERDQRAFSHGCVRVQEWESLGSILAGKSESAIVQETEGNRTHIENIKDVPLYLTYGTTAFKDGQLVRYPDVYGLGRVEFPGATAVSSSNQEAQNAEP